MFNFSAIIFLRFFSFSLVHCKTQGPIQYKYSYVVIRFTKTSVKARNVYFKRNILLSKKTFTVLFDVILMYTVSKGAEDVMGSETVECSRNKSEFAVGVCELEDRFLVSTTTS